MIIISLLDLRIGDKKKYYLSISILIKEDLKFLNISGAK